MKFKTNIEITSDAANKYEAMEIAGDYLSGNISSGIDMKYDTRPVRFYNNPAAKIGVVVLLMTMGFFSGVKAKPSHQGLSLNACQTATVAPALKTSDVVKINTHFKKEWQEKHTSEVIHSIKR